MNTNKATVEIWCDNNFYLFSTLNIQIDLASYTTQLKGAKVVKIFGLPVKQIEKLKYILNIFILMFQDLEKCKQMWSENVFEKSVEITINSKLY